MVGEIRENPTARCGGGQTVAMLDLWPDPVPGAPLTSRSLAQLAMGVSARDVADHARDLVPPGKRSGGYDGALVLDALRLCQLAAQALESAVVLERDDGTPWPVLEHILDAAPAAGLTRTEDQPTWPDVVDTWHKQVERASSPARTPDMEFPEALADPPMDVVHRLDEWLVRHREPGDPHSGDPHSGDPICGDLISDVVEQMNPLLELMHRQGQRTRLLDFLSLTPPHEVLATILDREALLHDALAANPHYPAPENAADAAHVRAMAAELRARLPARPAGDRADGDH